MLTSEFYKYYIKAHKKRYKDTPLKKPYSYEEANTVLLAYFELLWNKLISGFCVELPDPLGRITILKYKPTKKAIDFNQSKLQKKTVYHFNIHSGFYTYKIEWWRVARDNVETIFPQSIFRCRLINTYRFKLKELIKSPSFSSKITTFKV